MFKKATIFLAFILFATIGYAQHTAVFVIDDFSKMLQSQVSPYLLPPNAATVARNVRSNDVYGALAKRLEMLDYGDMGAYAVTSLHRYYNSDGTKILLGTGSTFIMSGDDDTGVFTILRDELTSGLRWDWVTYKNTAIGCNGTNNCQKYDGATTTTDDTDGARTVNILTADLGAPYAELATGTDLDASSWYQYKVAFYNSSTGLYYYSTARSNPILTGAGVYSISLTDIPLGVSGTTHRYIYRTLGGASRAVVEADTTFYLVDVIANNTATTVDAGDFDYEADADADDDNVPKWSTAEAGSNVTPPIAKYITIHKERIFLANAPNLNSYIYWTDAFYHQYFPVANYDYIRIDDGDDITFLEEQLGKVVIGKTNSITNFDTQNSLDTKWQLFTFSFVGCPAPYSVAKSPLGLIYLGWDGIYVFNGESSQLISDVVTQQIRDISPSNYSEAVGVYHESEYQLSYTSEEEGAGENDTVLVLDTIRNAYVIDDKNINCFEVFDSGTDFGTLYSGSSKADGEVVAHTSSLSNLIFKYKSSLNEGTKDSIVVSGTESEPEMSLGWGITIDSLSMTMVSLNSVTYVSSTINRESTTGYWWSPATEVNSTDYSKLYWNETLGTYGNVTFAIRSAATEAAVTADTLAWSSEYSSPSGSDVSALTPNEWIQLRSILTTSNIQYSPTLDSLNNFMIKLIYSRTGTGSEGTIESQYATGFIDFKSPTKPKRIWGVDVYYTGTDGTINFDMENSRGDIDTDFDLDLSIGADDDTTDRYFGNGLHKIYKWLAPANSSTNPTPIGRSWKFTITESATTIWNIYKIIVKYSPEEYYDD